MKKNTVFAMLLAVLLLTACGTESGKFRLEGRLRNMNQAEFWVYSPDGAISGIDTIRVRDGRFSYEVDMTGEHTLIVIFPNYSEQAVFAESGGKVTIKGDATHMKEMIIEGSDDNEELTTLRMKLNDLTPPDIPAAVGEFIKEHPKSQASVYLLRRYFVASKEPNYRMAKHLADLMLKESPDNTELLALQRQLKSMLGAPLMGKLPKFEASDIKGQKVTNGYLSGEVNVVYAWASWSYQSSALQNRLNKLKKEYGERLAVVGICLDADAKACRRRVTSDSLRCRTVCDGKMWDTPLLTVFSMADVPDNVVADKRGNVIARNITAEMMEEKINKLLKQ